MSFISVTAKGNFKKTLNFLNNFRKGDIFSDFGTYGRMGVDVLSSATPVDTGLTANSWSYKVLTDPLPGIAWYNYNDEDNGSTPVVILIQYGHGTGTGGYVQGRDFINPAIQPIFDEIANDVWKKVMTA